MDIKKRFAFITSIYSEHLAEASFLYEQRLTLLDNPEFSWIDFERIENRIEPHIDALVTGGELALNICTEKAEEGDAGEFYAAVSIFCRQNLLDIVNKVLKNLDPQDKERIQAVTDAFKNELPDSWQPEIIKMLSSNDEKLISIAAKVVGYRRISAEKELLNLLRQNEPVHLSNFIWAIGRMPNRKNFKSEIKSILLPYLNHKDENIGYETALALLRTGELESVNEWLKTAHLLSKNLILIGLTGDISYIPAILEIASQKNPSPDSLTAIGLLGDISAIPFLNHLLNEESAKTASLALNLITGAELYEEVFIPEAIDKDLLFDDEIEKLEKGEPLYPPGKEPGTTITRISQNQEEWNIWWQENKSNFNSATRYRNGKPYSSACLIENLESSKTPSRIRRIAYEDLVIHYNIDFPFETDMFVSEQKKAIIAIKALKKGSVQ